VTESIFEDPDFFSQVVLGSGPESLDADDPRVAIPRIRAERTRLIRQASRIHAVLRQQRDELSRRGMAIDRRSADLDQRERELRLWWEERSEQALALDAQRQAEFETLRTRAAGLAGWEATLKRQQDEAVRDRETADRRLNERQAELESLARSLHDREAELGRRVADVNAREVSLAEERRQLDAARERFATERDEAHDRLEATRAEVRREADALIAWERELAGFFAGEASIGERAPQSDAPGPAPSIDAADEGAIASELRLAADAARVADLIDQVQSWLASIVRATTNGVTDRRRSTAVDDLDEGLRGRMREGIERVIALIESQRRETASWLAARTQQLHREREIERQRWASRQQAWNELKRRWLAIDASHDLPAPPHLAQMIGRRRRSDRNETTSGSR